MNTVISIKHWSLEDQPRQKLLTKGVDSLSNSELLALLINNGTRQKTAVDLAVELLRLGQDNLNEFGKLSLYDIEKVKGIGKAKAITIFAALEFGRRRQASIYLDKIVIKSSNDIAQYLRTVIKDYAVEVFAVLFLNRANKINHFEIISKGGISGTVADPRIILKKALEANATSLILCHNHPSGNLRPSNADEQLTLKIKTAANFCDIKVLDHLIVSDEGYYSFADEGIL